MLRLQALDDVLSGLVCTDHAGPCKSKPRRTGRVDRPRIDQLQANADPVQIELQALGQIDQGRLRGAMGGVARQTAITCSPRHDGDVALPPCLHVGHCRQQTIDDTVHIDRKAPLESVAMQIVAPHRDCHPRIEHGQRQVAVIIFDRCQHTLHILRVGDIAIENDDAAVGGSFLLQGHQFFVISGGDDHRIAVSHQPQCQRSAYSRTRSRYPCQPMLGIRRCAYSLPIPRHAPARCTLNSRGRRMTRPAQTNPPPISGAHPERPRP